MFLYPYYIRPNYFGFPHLSKCLLLLQVLCRFLFRPTACFIHHFVKYAAETSYFVENHCTSVVTVRDQQEKTENEEDQTKHRDIKI
jgi:hypothetical protein